MQQREVGTRAKVDMDGRARARRREGSPDNLKPSEWQVMSSDGLDVESISRVGSGGEDGGQYARERKRANFEEEEDQQFTRSAREKEKRRGKGREGKERREKRDVHVPSLGPEWDSDGEIGGDEMKRGGAYTTPKRQVCVRTPLESPRLSSLDSPKILTLHQAHSSSAFTSRSTSPCGLSPTSPRHGFPLPNPKP